MADGGEPEGPNPASGADRPASSSGDGADGESADRPTVEEVTAAYDFEEFGPREMDEMSAAEWEVAFDAESWVTGAALLDRVEQDLTARIERRDVFAVIERETREVEDPDAPDGFRTEERLVAYADEGYAAVYTDGSVEGEGTVLRDVKPSVALCSMPDYEVPEPSGDGTLPDPEAIEAGGGELGNLVLLAIGAVQVLAGVVLLGAWVLRSLPLLTAVFALFFLGFGVFLLVVVANARLAARFRSEEYRDRLRALDLRSSTDGPQDAGSSGHGAGRDPERE